MQTDEQEKDESKGQNDSAGGQESGQNDSPPATDAESGGKEPETTTVSKTDLAELQRLAKDGQNYKGAVARLEQELSEEKARNEEFSKDRASSPLPAAKPENLDEETAKVIERDFKRQSKDLLSEAKELDQLTALQRREFEREYQLRSSLSYQEALKTGEYVPVSSLKKAMANALRFVRGATPEEEMRKARLQGQKDMLDKESGNIGNARQSSTEKKAGEISAEALGAAETSLLVKEGLMSKEEMAKRIQKRIDEGR